MRRFSTRALLLISTWTSPVSCWGNLGHRTVAELAQLYLHESEIHLLRNISGFPDLSDAAIWPDEVSKTPEYAYTSSWHYVNVHDSPPEYCGIVLPRDHQPSSSDLFTAFVNHSTILRDGGTPASEREAARFLIHWLGDVHQPLHLENLAKGGNDIHVRFDGEHTTLHIVWDVHVPAKLRQPKDEKLAAKSWAEDLFRRDKYPNISLGSECQDTATPFSCIIGWADESNAHVCSTVMPHGVEALLKVDLAGSYYDIAVPVVEERIGAAGRRLAAWMRVLLAEYGRDGRGNPAGANGWKVEL